MIHKRKRYLKKASAALLLLILMFVQGAKAFHRHATAIACELKTAETVIEKSTVEDSSCSICDFTLTKESSSTILLVNAPIKWLADNRVFYNTPAFVAAYISNTDLRGPPVIL